MSKHTPGPWVAEPVGGKGSWVKGSTGEWAALACGDTSESAEANARLIAAAPDMLEALNAIQRLEFAGSCCGCSTDEAFDEAQEIARKAIDKVEGQP